MEITHQTIKNILTRTTGYLKTVTSHSLQPYRGCSFGSSLCGVGCYVRHNRWLTQGRAWGAFLEVRDNAAEAYRTGYERERRWARRQEGRGEFSIFLSSSTEPFLPQEKRFRITRQILEAMIDRPPDLLILQSHSHTVAEYRELYRELQERCRLRVHLSIETDRERLPGLPPPGSSVERRFAAARALKDAGIPTVITVSPLLPIQDPDAFFQRCAACADAVVLDHFIGGDGTPDGRRTRTTPLPDAMAALEPGSDTLAYRDRMVAIAQRHLQDRVGVSIDGFAGRLLTAPR
jgi:DNA repair photolyase